MPILNLLLSMLLGVEPASSGLAASVRPIVSRPLVAVIDSGVARTPELSPFLVAEYDFGSSVPRAAFRPRYDHGTMVATILVRAARQPVDIVSFRIDDAAGCAIGKQPPCQRSPLRIASAIRQASTMGVRAINISLALEDHPAIVDAVRDAAAKGILIVLAAGNDGLDHPGNLTMARAAFPNAVLVGALDRAGQMWSGTNRPGGTGRGYNYAWQLGVAVRTVGANGTAIFGTGTSFAVPLETARLVAGWPLAMPLASLVQTTGAGAPVGGGPVR